MVSTWLWEIDRDEYYARDMVVAVAVAAELRASPWTKCSIFDICVCAREVVCSMCMLCGQ